MACAKQNEGVSTQQNVISPVKKSKGSGIYRLGLHSPRALECCVSVNLFVQSAGTTMIPVGNCRVFNENGKVVCWVEFGSKLIFYRTRFAYQTYCQSHSCEDVNLG